LTKGRALFAIGDYTQAQNSLEKSIEMAQTLGGAEAECVKQAELTLRKVNLELGSNKGNINDQAYIPKIVKGEEVKQ
jgi:hypothetical protein